MSKLAIIKKLPTVQAHPQTGKIVEIISPKPPSPLPSVGSKDYARAWRMNLTYLRGCLPPNSQSLFTARKYGNHIGIPIVCPHCMEKPGRHIKHHARWRWLTFHIATRHTNQ